jgi:hypothetical protein
VTNRPPARIVGKANRLHRRVGSGLTDEFGVPVSSIV